MKKRYVIDVETESTVDLPKAGAYAYSAHPSTDIMCVSWRDIDEPPEKTRHWFPRWTKVENQIPPDLQFAVAIGAELWAHNAFFEQCIWNNVLVKRYGWPPLSVSRWHCSAALAAYYGYSQNLDRCVAAVFNGEKSKDKTGHMIMMKLCNPSKRPKKVTINEADGSQTVYDLSRDYPKLLQRLYEYCDADVNVEADLIQALGPFPKDERAIWIIDQEINHRGIPFDVELVDAACKAVHSIREAACAELSSVTGGVIDEMIDSATEAIEGLGAEVDVTSIPKQITTPNQVQRIQQYCAARGVHVENLQAPTVDTLLEHPGLPADVRQVLEIRKAAGTAAIKKFLRANLQLTDHRARGLLKYYGAHTGRWTGQGTQPSNMPRKHFDDDWETEHWVSEIKEMFK